MREIEIGEAGPLLNELIDQARGGEEVSLTDGGRVRARIVAVDVETVVKPPRRLGLAAGQFTLPDDFDAPLSDDVLALFYDGPIFPEPAQPDKRRDPDRI